MKNKKKLFIIIGIVFIIILVLLVCLIMNRNLKPANNTPVDAEKEPSNTGSVTETVKTLVKNVLTLDEAFSGDALSVNSVFKNDYGNDCYHYTGPDTEKMIDLIDSVYYHSGHGMFIFSTTKIDNKDVKQLYVCPPPGCTREKIDSSNYSIESQDNNFVTLKMNDNYYILQYDAKGNLGFVEYVCKF